MGFGAGNPRVNQKDHSLPSWNLKKVKMLVSQSYPTLCDSTDYNPPGLSVCGIRQARIREWVAIPFSRGSYRPSDLTHVSHIAGRFFTI